jgi:hypothetical protein
LGKYERFGLSDSPVLTKLIDQLGGMIEASFPFANMKEKGIYSRTHVIKAALDYSNKHIYDASLSPAETDLYHHAYMEHRAQYSRQVNCILGKTGRDQLSRLTEFLKSNQEIHESLMVDEPNGARFPSMLVVYVALMFTLHSLKLKEKY